MGASAQLSRAGNQSTAAERALNYMGRYQLYSSMYNNLSGSKHLGRAGARNTAESILTSAQKTAALSENVHVTRGPIQQLFTSTVRSDAQVSAKTLIGY